MQLTPQNLNNILVMQAIRALYEAPFASMNCVYLLIFTLCVIDS